MNRIKLISTFVLLIIIQSFAQDSLKLKHWQHLSFSTDSVYGTESTRAYNELLKGKKGRKIIVAVIDSGCDTEHEDLKNVLWVNEGEIPGNGIDDDNNGYIDDVHGWNFLGDVSGETLELTRKYITYNKEFLNVKNTDNLSKKESKRYKEYLKVKKELEGERAKFEKYRKRLTKHSETFKENYNVLLTHLGKDDFSTEDLKKISSTDSTIIKSKKAIELLFKKNKKSKTLKELIAKMSEKEAKSKKYYSRKLDFNLNPEFISRKESDYDESNFDNFNYGNNTYLVGGKDNGHGTHCAGIIAAERDNKKGMNGIADNVEIMVIRAVPEGDEHDRDIAGAMRYAADNGANIISMSYGKSVSFNKEGVDEAIKYCVEKNILFIHAAGNSSKNLDVEDNFPNVKNSKKNAKSWIEVGASSWEIGKNIPAIFSNYGKKSVDLFAPGVKIYSTVPFSSYDSYNGTSMATPVVAGVAAILMSYFPDLSAQQVKKILMKSVTKLNSMDVNLPNNKRKKDYKMVKFGDLSRSGGIVNAYKAVKLAEKMTK